MMTVTLARPFVAFSIVPVASKPFSPMTLGMRMGQVVVVVTGTVVVVTGTVVVVTGTVVTGTVDFTPVTEVVAEEVLGGIDVVEEGVAFRVAGSDEVVGGIAVVVGLGTVEADGSFAFVVEVVEDEESVPVEQGGGEQTDSQTPRRCTLLIRSTSKKVA